MSAAVPSREWVDDSELYSAPGWRMPSLAAAILVSVRQRTGLTQRQLAERAGTSATAISAIEAGRRQPSLETLLRIVRAAGLDLRITVAPADDHDEVLRTERAALSSRKRRSRDAAFNNLLDSLAEGLGDAPLLQRIDEPVERPTA
jgi:transcriptional regulator with XRE-family HTH domain